MTLSRDIPQNQADTGRRTLKKFDDFREAGAC
jgi:hypothetical protein